MDNLELERCKIATNIFYKLATATSKDARLRYGAKQRELINEAVSKGNDIDHYRIEWLEKSSMEVIKTLLLVSKKFDTNYFFDMISLNDLKDVLNHALKRLETYKKAK
jgi:hypothetical protein